MKLRDSRRALMNRRRLTDAMAQAGLDGLIASSPVNVAYLSGYRCLLEPLFRGYMVTPGAGDGHPLRSFCVVTADGSVALVIDAGTEAHAVATTAGDLTLYETAADGSGGPVPCIASVLARLGLRGTRVGVEPAGFERRERSSLREAVPAELLDCTNLLRLVRMVKTEAEIELLARAAAVSEIALEAAVDWMVPERPLRESIDRYREVIGRGGADFEHFAVGRPAGGFAYGPDVLLQQDDVFALDVGCLYDDVYADTGVTVAFAPPSPELARRHEGLYRAVAEIGPAAARPGVRGSEVQRAMQDYLREEGIEGAYPHGHGLGLEAREYPILARPNALRIADDCVDLPSDLELEAGMVINLEACIFVPDAGSVQRADCRSAEPPGM